MSKKITLQEIETIQCDFCENEASDNCWGHRCQICGRDLCDDHLMRPIEQDSFTVCPECNKLDLSEIVKLKREITEAYDRSKNAEKRLTDSCAKMKEKFYPKKQEE